MELSNALNDDDLWNLISRCNVETLQSLLRKGDVPYSKANKAALQMRLYYAIRLGLPVAKTDVQKDQERNRSRSDKLQISPGMSVPHPLLLEDGWETFPHATFPDVTSDRIQEYFVLNNQKEGLQTGGQKALKEGRSMSLAEGRVYDVKYNAINSLIVLGYVSGLVVPQTRVSERPYMVWVMMYKTTGVIHKAECHCIAGLSGICKHVAALLYRVADGVEKGLNKACTSTLQTWHQPSKKLKTAAFIEDIKTPKASASMTYSERPRRDKFDPRPTDMRRKRNLGDYQLDTLSDITSGKAAALLYAANFRELQPPSQKPDLSVVGEVIEVECSACINTCSVSTAYNKHKDNFDCFMQELSLSKEDQDWLVSLTQGQSTSNLWHDQRKGRLTASNIGNVISHVDDSGNIRGSTHSVTASIMGYYRKTDFEPQSLKWGRARETTALFRYKDVHQSHHASSSTQKTGLWVSTDQPFLAASPDSLVTCKCCGDGVVEVKNPWTYRNLTITDLASTGKSHLVLEDGKPMLDKKHSYYAQVQLQMFCTGRNYCDFVTLTEAPANNFHLTKVSADVDFIVEMIAKAEVFLRKVILPELDSRIVEKAVSAVTTIYSLVAIYPDP